MSGFQKLVRFVIGICAGLAFLHSTVLGWVETGTVRWNLLLPMTAIALVLWTLYKSEILEWLSPGAFIFATLAGLVLIFAFKAIADPDSAAVQNRKTFDLSGTFKSLDGREVSLNSYRNKVMFLNIWASWCGPCQSEMPSMANLYNELGKEGLAVVAISNEAFSTVDRFVAQNRFPFTVLVDEDDTLIRRYQIRGIPTTFILDAEGRLVQQFVGARRWDSPENIVHFRQLLEGSDPSFLHWISSLLPKLN